MSIITKGPHHKKGVTKDLIKLTKSGQRLQRIHVSAKSGAGGRKGWEVEGERGWTWGNTMKNEECGMLEGGTPPYDSYSPKHSQLRLWSIYISSWFTWSDQYHIMFHLRFNTCWLLTRPTPLPSLLTTSFADCNPSSTCPSKASLSQFRSRKEGKQETRKREKREDRTSKKVYVRP